MVHEVHPIFLGMLAKPASKWHLEFYDKPKPGTPLAQAITISRVDGLNRMSPELNLGQLFTALEGQEDVSISQILSNTPKNPQEFNELLTDFLSQEEIPLDEQIQKLLPAGSEETEFEMPTLAELSRQALATESNSVKATLSEPLDKEFNQVESSDEPGREATSDVTFLQSELELESESETHLVSVPLTHAINNESQDSTKVEEAISHTPVAVKKSDEKQQEPELVKQALPAENIIKDDIRILKQTEPVENIHSQVISAKETTSESTNPEQITVGSPLPPDSSMEPVIHHNHSTALDEVITSQEAYPSAIKPALAPEKTEVVTKSTVQPTETKKDIELVQEQEMEAVKEVEVDEMPDEALVKQTKELVQETKVMSGQEVKSDPEFKQLAQQFSNSSQSQSQHRGQEQQQSSEPKVANVSTAQATSSQDVQAKPVMQKPTVESVGEHLGAEKWKEGFADKVRWFAVNGVKNAIVQINPRDLGPIAIRLETIDNQMNLHFTVSNDSVKAAIDTAQPQIRELLQQNGFNLDSFSSSESSKEHTNGEGAFSSHYQKTSAGETLPDTGVVEQQVDSEQGIVNLYI